MQTSDADSEAQVLSRREFFERLTGNSTPAAARRFSGDDPPKSGTERLLVLEPDRCAAWSGHDCRMCFVVCPHRGRALVFEAERPRVEASACDGCGVCIEACRTVNDLAALRWMRA